MEELRERALRDRHDDSLSLTSDKYDKFDKYDKYDKFDKSSTCTLSFSCDDEEHSARKNSNCIDDEHLLHCGGIDLMLERLLPEN